MKKIIIIVFLLAISLVVTLKGRSKANVEPKKLHEKEAAVVSIQSVSNSKTYQEKLNFSGLIIGDQEATVSAKSSGTIKVLNFEFGKPVASRQLLVKIDDTGSHLSEGKNNLQSGVVLQLELASRVAKESLELAEKNYDKDSSFTNRTARDIAKRQYESAEVALASALDSSNILSPISGTVIEKNVSLGDSVSAGQTLAIISQTNLKKVRFFVSEKQLSVIKLGNSVSLINNDSGIISAKIQTISPQADATTKKFAVEAIPDSNNNLKLGSIVSVSLNIILSPQKPNSLILPLTAVTIAQNENYIFIAENNQAKKVSVTIEKISGETAEISTNIPENAEIIIEGNKFLQEGDEVVIK